MEENNAMLISELKQQVTSSMYQVNAHAVASAMLSRPSARWLLFYGSEFGAHTTRAVGPSTSASPSA